MLAAQFEMRVTAIFRLHESCGLRARCADVVAIQTGAVTPQCHQSGLACLPLYKCGTTARHF
jgi:hypothetical protein